MIPCPRCSGDRSAPDHDVRCCGRQGALEFEFELEAEAAPDISGMVHRDDPGTSIEAAVAITHCRTELHQRIREAISARGAMTDGELETLPEFHGYGPSTIRKRRSELFQAHELVAVGVRRNSRNHNMLVWDLVKT